MSARNWVQRLGMGDALGDISFNKVITLASLALFGAMVLGRIDPSPWTLTFGITVIGAGFGLKGFMAARAGVTLTGTSASTVDGTAAATAIGKAVAERIAHRDADAGIDPS